MEFRNLPDITDPSVQRELAGSRYEEEFEITLLMHGEYVCVNDQSILYKDYLLNDENHPIVKGVNNSRIRSLIREYKKRYGKQLYLEGVVVGEDIEGNKESFVGQHFFLTDIFDLDEEKWVLPRNRSASYKKYSKADFSEYTRLLNFNMSRGTYLRMVPYSYFFEPFKKISLLSSQDEIVSKLREMAPGPSFNSTKRRKGLVFKATQTDYAFKVISDEFRSA